jgi:type IV secretion system protein VirD4
MMILGMSSIFFAIVFGIFVAHRLARYNKGMDGLHGTAHFAERDDVDKTGFINAPGHKPVGVIIGSVMLDSKGKVIHPHHKQYNNRYKPIFIRGKGLRYFQKYPKRDGNNRPMYAVKKSIVRSIELMRDGGNTHLFAFCPTRSGKGTGMVIPTLLTYPFSVMVNDPKGEAYALSAGFRQAAGQDIVKFQPACTDGSGARWNPLDEIRIFELYDVSDAQMIMSMACDPKGEGLEDYFDKAGYEFLTALALHVRYAEKDGSLAGVAYFLGDPNWDSDKQMYTHMMGAEHDKEGKMKWIDSNGKPTKTHPMIANAAKTMLNKEDKDRSGVLSTAKSLLSLYLDPIVAMNTSHSDFLVRDLMTGKKPVSLYYVVGPADMERLVPLTRLFYALFIRRNAAEMEFSGGRSVANYTHPLLMIIDEATSLKKLPILQEALGYVAGYGIRMFMLVQDITQVEELYGDKQSFDSGAETRIVYAPNKIETAEKLARMSGKTTVTEENASNSRDIIGIKAGSVSLSTSKTARDLVTADEFLMLHDQDVVVFIKGQPPVYGRKAFYYENPVMLGRAKILAPAQSSRLRMPVIAEDVVVIEKFEIKPETPMDNWVASREALRDRVATMMAPVAAAPSAQVIALATAPGVAIEKPKSRYASKVHVMSEEDRQQVQTLVANVALMDKVVAISAF